MDNQRPGVGRPLDEQEEPNPDHSARILPSFLSTMPLNSNPVEERKVEQARHNHDQILRRPSREHRVVVVPDNPSDEVQLPVPLRRLAAQEHQENFPSKIGNWGIKRDHIPRTRNSSSTGNGFRASSTSACPSWHSETKVHKKLAYMLEQGILLDIKFLVGAEKEIISCHRIVLAMNSPVFEAMVSDRWNPGVEFCELPEVQPSTFRNFLKCIYTGELPPGMSSTRTLQLLAFAKQYLVNSIESKCISILESSINVKSCIAVYESAKFLDENELLDRALGYISRNANDVFKSEEFLGMSHDELSALLAIPNFEIQELELFKAALNWAEAECLRKELEYNSTNIRNVLGSALYLIRFPLMEADEFTFEVMAKGILNSDEAVRVLSFISVTPAKRARLENMTLFMVNTRRPSRIFEINRFRDAGSTACSYGRRRNTLEFEVDVGIEIISLGFYSALNRAGVFNIYFKIKREGGKECVTRMENVYSEKKKIFHVTVNPPFKIAAFALYTISYKIDGLDTAYGKPSPGSMSGHATIKKNCGQFGPVTFQFDGSGGPDPDYGFLQVPEIKFGLL